MANTKISGLTSATTPLDGTEVLPIVQSSTTKKVANNDLRPKQIQSNATSGILQVAGPTAGTTRVMTTPDANFTAARTDAAQSFTGDQTLGTGNLIQGTAAKGFNFTANTPAAGKTSQLLNWYEEGTWTPTISGDTTSGTQTYTWQYGAYTRIGRQVTCTASVRIATTSGMAGSLVIGGLPFTSRSGDRIAGSVHLAIWGNLTAGQVYIAGYVSPSSTTATLTGSTGATGNLTGLAVSTFAAGSYIDAVITYMT